MALETNDIELKIEELAEEMRTQFELVGEEIKERILSEFAKVLLKDVKGLEKIVDQLIKVISRQIRLNSQSEMQASFDNKFGDSVFGKALGDAISSGVTQNNRREATRSGEFRESLGQGLNDFAKSLARARNRNS